MDRCYLNIRRQDQRISSGGENSNRARSKVPYTHPDIADVGHRRAIRENNGEEVMAWSSSARRHVKRRRACRLVQADRDYKIPRHWKFVDSFPMTVTARSKVQDAETAVEEPWPGRGRGSERPRTLERRLLVVAFDGPDTRFRTSFM